ncbi:hypothetical protein [Pseudoalteromonas sp. OF7H-1]|uniref:hypothetical protein n=1 Tax=Pseudoalteromonas sp. OF7H-1 TaxID=2917755 RepID=UPI001EF5C035|nr:hypothetical protein [Pseudoalteromonas sp. OF7H-1]MCG7540241.1 hypothetical protein [Pseudoalteromonas sp. OF7H-1]
MEWKILIPVCIASIVAVVGWVIGHKLNSDRDLRNNQRELRLKYLIEAYDVFHELGRNINILGNYLQVEKAVNNIMLIGTPRQIELCKKFVQEVTSNNGSNHTELVVEIRNFIRAELGLKIIDKELMALKIEPRKNIDKA